MWHADPDITYQLARDEQEKKISDHVRRTQARKQKQGGLISTVLGQVGDWLVGAGEALRRRSQTATPLANDGFGI